MTNETIQRLEYLSDQVRLGIPIDLKDAIVVIEYQEKLKADREQSHWSNLITWIGRILK